MTAIEQCQAEIDRRERSIRAGESLEMEGLLQGLQDWSSELRLIEAEKPLAIDLFCGLGGWTDGLLAEGYRVVGFDIERHRYPVTGGWHEYPAQLVLQDILTIHGSQFRDAALIVASPPCQNYSYLAMPWSRSKDPNNSKAAKALRLKWETEGPDNRLFDACFRIQREAIEATQKTCKVCHGGKDDPWTGYTCSECGGSGWTERRYIPLIVENVRGAQPWVGRSAWNYGSFHLWGDVPALMPITLTRPKKGIGGGWFPGDGSLGGNPGRTMELMRPGGPLDGQKVPGFRFHGSGRSFQSASVEATGQKVPPYSDPRRNGGKVVHLMSPSENGDGLKIGGDWFSDPNSTCRKHGSRSNARKAASAQIAKIPLELSRHIATVYKPRSVERAA